MLFLVKDKNFLVFTAKDPSQDVYTGEVIEGTTLDYHPSVSDWPRGAERPGTFVGHAEDDPKRYKVFQYHRELAPAGYRPVSGVPAVFNSWRDYTRLRCYRPGEATA